MSKSFYSEYTNEPLVSSPQLPQKLSATPWFDVNIPFSMMILGMTRAGKGVMMDWAIQQMYDAGIQIIHLFSALGFENLFYIVNKNCRDRWKVELDIHQEKKYDLHCNCHGTIKTLWMIPDYIEMSQKSIQDYNEKMGKSVLKTMKFTTPTTPPRTELFRNQFRKIVETAKKEHRIIVNSPAIYPADHHGKMEKYHTVAEVLRYVQEELCEDPLFRRSTTRKDNWEKSQHKICIVLNEARACAPSAKFSGDK